MKRRKIYRRRRRSELDLLALLMSRLRSRNMLPGTMASLQRAFAITALIACRKAIKVMNYELGRPTVTTRSLKR